jgi:hypothetical protein
MAGGYDDSHDADHLSDAEFSALVRDRIGELARIDPATLDITVTDGVVKVAGRVGSEAEYQAIEQVLTDLPGLGRAANELIIDPLARPGYDEAADVANAQLYDEPRSQRGGAHRTEDSAAHLLDDTEAEQFGTGDVGEAVERGYSYNPPLAPFQEGHDADQDADESQ